MYVSRAKTYKLCIFFLGMKLSEDDLYFWSAINQLCTLEHIYIYC